MIRQKMKSTKKHVARREAPKEFTHYRLTSVGEALKDTLDEMVKTKVFTEEHKEAALCRFDQVFTQMLREVPQKTVRLGGKVLRYKNVNDVWMLVVKDLSLKVDTTQVVVQDEPSKVVSIKRR